MNGQPDPIFHEVTVDVDVDGGIAGHKIAEEMKIHEKMKMKMNDVDRVPWTQWAKNSLIDDHFVENDEILWHENPNVGKKSKNWMKNPCMTTDVEEDGVDHISLTN